MFSEITNIYVYLNYTVKSVCTPTQDILRIIIDPDSTKDGIVIIFNYTNRTLHTANTVKVHSTDK